MKLALAHQPPRLLQAQSCLGRVPLNVAAERLVRGIGGDVGVAIEAVLHGEPVSFALSLKSRRGRSMACSRPLLSIRVSLCVCRALRYTRHNP